MTWLGWVTVVATLLTVVALFRCFRLVSKTFPSNGHHGTWSAPVVEQTQIESWPHADARSARLGRASSNPKGESSLWLREVTPIASVAAGVRRERSGTHFGQPDIPDRWSTEWLTNECAEIEAAFGLELPPRAAVRVGRLKRFRRWLTGPPVQ